MSSDSQVLFILINTILRMCLKTLVIDRTFSLKLRCVLRNASVHQCFSSSTLYNPSIIKMNKFVSINFNLHIRF